MMENNARNLNLNEITLLLKLRGYSVVEIDSTNGYLNVKLEELASVYGFTDPLREAAHLLIFDQGKGVKTSSINKIIEEYGISEEEFFNIIKLYFQIIGMDVVKVPEEDIIALVPSDHITIDLNRFELTPTEQRLLILIYALLLVNRGKVAKDQVIEEAEFHQISQVKRRLRDLIKKCYVKEENGTLTPDWKLRVIMKNQDLRHQIIQKLKHEKLKLITISQLISETTILGKEND